MASQQLCELEGRTLIIMFHGKLVVLNVLTVPHEQHGWLSWAVAAAPLGPGLPTTVGRWLFVGVMGQPCHVGASGRNRRPIQLELSFAILHTLLPWSWGPSSHVLNWRRSSSSIETTVTGKRKQIQNTYWNKILYCRNTSFCGEGRILAWSILVIVITWILEDT